MSTNLRVVIADDQALIRTGFQMILDSEPDIEVVDLAEDGQQAVSSVSTHRPDVVLMDIRMPNLDGIEATRAITAAHPETRILILTTFDLDEYVYAAIEAGATGFLLKDTPPETLADGIRVVASGDSLLSPSVTRRLVEKFASQPGREIKPVQGIEDLTEREHEVLLRMAEGLSNSEIAEALFVGETTVKTHVGRVLMKLGVRDRVQAVVAAYESGIVVPGS